jgi:hypothetical protein
LAVGEADAVVEDAFAEDALALNVEEGAAESEAAVDAGMRRPSSPRAKNDDPKNTNTMAATATLIILPRSERKCACSSN